MIANVHVIQTNTNYALHCLLATLTVNKILKSDPLNCVCLPSKACYVELGAGVVHDKSLEGFCSDPFRLM